MRGFLLDENLPDDLPLSASQLIVHTRALSPSLTDSELWSIAERECWVIVSKDADFAERMIFASPPPWVVFLRIGNVRLAEYRAFIVRVWPQIEALLPAHKLITVYSDRIEAIAEP